MTDELALLPDDERAEMEAYIDKAKSRKTVKFENGDVAGENNLEIIKGYKRLQEITKTNNPDIARGIVLQAAACSNSNDHVLSQAVDMLEDFAPQTPLEAMLISQMIAVNGAIRKMMTNAFIPEQTFAGKQLNLNQVTKMQRTFLQQVEALQKLRGLTGQQTVRVEHVTVEAGGQAIVGNVDHGGGGKSGK
jgi:hypothetical protein